MNTVLRFIACSDLHFKTDCPDEPARLRRGLGLIYAYAAKQPYKKLDAVIVVGDFANSGRQDEMLLVKRVFDESLRPETKLVLTLASHEFFSEDGEEGAKRRFRELFRQEEDVHFVLNGCHFIALSTERGCSIGDEKKAWLRAALKEAAGDRDKPVFVFQHPHLSDTVYGSINWGDDDILSILSDYPGVVDFSGHSHAPVNDPRSICQRLFTSVGTGSLSYFELDEFDFSHGTIPHEAKSCAQFQLVEVGEKGEVLVRPFDILSENFFNDGWLIPTPWEPSSFTYTDRRYRTAKAPAFAPGTVLQIRFEVGRALVSFPQAEGEERPDAYLLTVRDDNNRVVCQRKITSRYYLYDMPPTLSFDPVSLPAGGYVAGVTPLGFWRNAGAPILKRFTVEG